MAECLGCGNCCRYVMFTPALSHRGVKDWLDAHDIELVDVGDREMLRFNIPCKNLLESGKCGKYENRPEMCKKFPVGAIPECPFWGVKTSEV